MQVRFYAIELNHGFESRIKCISRFVQMHFKEFVWLNLNFVTMLNLE